MRPETILVVHERYLERGGEDAVYEAEVRLLERSGHRVLPYERDNREVERVGRLRTAARAVWSTEDHRAIHDLVRRERVELAHFHNTFPLISPAGLHAARKAGAAVVQTLHNFRTLCANALLLRDARPCEKCVGRSVPWPAVAHRCYRGSAAGSAVVAASIAVHRVLRTWQQQVDVFIALSRFARARFIAGGLPPERIEVGGAFVEAWPGAAPGPRGSHFLYVGRLSEEKGVRVLLEAWKSVRGSLELKILGDGPLRSEVEAAAKRDPRIEWLGARDRGGVMAAMGAAYALVFPSLCYENAPAVLAEALASGLPVVASRLGSAAELVEESGAGALFEAGNAEALAGAVAELAGDAARRGACAAAGRAYHESHATPEEGYRRLMAAYGRALKRRHGAG